MWWGHALNETQAREGWGQARGKRKIARKKKNAHNGKVSKLGRGSKWGQGNANPGRGKQRPGGVTNHKGKGKARPVKGVATSNHHHPTQGGGKGKGTQNQRNLPRQRGRGW